MKIYVRVLEKRLNDFIFLLMLLLLLLEMLQYLKKRKMVDFSDGITQNSTLKADQFNKEWNKTLQVVIAKPIRTSIMIY